MHQASSTIGWHRPRYMERSFCPVSSHVRRLMDHISWGQARESLMEADIGAENCSALIHSGGNMAAKGEDSIRPGVPASPRLLQIWFPVGGPEVPKD